jgi:hypothetical protein
MEITSEPSPLNVLHEERLAIVHQAIIADDPFDLGHLDLPANSLDGRILTELKLHSKLLQQLVEHITSL